MQVDFYLGKRLAFIYKAKTEKKGSLYRVIWGKVRALGALCLLFVLGLCCVGGRAWSMQPGPGRVAAALGGCSWRQRCAVGGG